MREKKNEQRQKPKCIEIRSPSCFMSNLYTWFKAGFLFKFVKKRLRRMKKYMENWLDAYACIHILGALSIFAQPNKLQTRE